MELGDLFDLSTFTGILNLVLTIATFMLPWLWKRRKKQKRQAAKTNGIDYKFVKTSDWISADAKILKFEFAKKKILISKRANPPTSSLVAIVEFTSRYEKAPVVTEVYIGDEGFAEGETFQVKFNPLNSAEAVLN